MESLEIVLPVLLWVVRKALAAIEPPEATTLKMKTSRLRGVVAGEMDPQIVFPRGVSTTSIFLQTMYCMKCVTFLCMRVVSVLTRKSSYTLSGVRVVHTVN